MSSERHNGAFAVGLLLGAIGGSLAALWFAPVAGSETRQQLVNRLSGFVPGAGLPDHLDQGSYALNTSPLDAMALESAVGEHSDG